MLGINTKWAALGAIFAGLAMFFVWVYLDHAKWTRELEAAENQHATAIYRWEDGRWVEFRLVEDK